MKPRYLSMTGIIKLNCLCAWLMLSACTDNDFADLENFIQEVREIPGEKIEPLEGINDGDFFYFELDGSRDPFVIPEKIEEEVDESDLISTVNNGVKPDFTRIKEDLESFPLGSLEMVGTVRQGKLWALIRSDEGIQKVTVGNYIGKNHGKIIGISEDGIKLEEILEEDAELKTWVKKETLLPLKMDI